MQTTQHVPFRTMVARVSPDDVVIYANGALARYLGASKRQLVGTPLDVVAQRVRGEVASCFARPETGRTSSQLVTDSEGRVFEAKLYSEGGVLDIVLDEVTTAETIERELRDSSGTAVEELSEDELRTARHPERRYLSVSYTQLRGLAQVTERLAAMEVRLMVNSFVEEASDAIFETGCTVGETSGDSLLGVFGAPRYFADHPLRAIQAACSQMQKAAMLHAGFYREGKELPPCSAGIWTGDTLVGTLGNSVWQHYTAIGSPVELAQRLCMLARPGEILLPEHTLTHLLRVLPEGWQHIRASSEHEPDLSDFQWVGDEIEPVAEHLRKVVYLIGPGVQDDTERMEFYFDYLWSFRVPGRDQSIPILRVVRPSQVGDSLELRNDNVVTSQAVQTLGKYKLIEVIGTGGMGRVWRGVDRFGNAVAIKVLHSSEAVTEAQIRRFRREAEVMARLPHRNICRVFEMNEFEGVQYLAMEFVEGLPLSDLLYEKTSSESMGQAAENADLRALISSIRSEKSRTSLLPPELTEEQEEAPRAKKTRILPVEQTLSIFLKVCDAVQFAHEHGVLHRDLKPGNILLREDGEPLVADFGLAKMNTSDATHSLSMTGHVVGTLENMSPEQAESSKDVDERADVYSLGTILYQMLAGRRHFEATGNIVADAQALQAHEPPRLRVFNPHVDPDLEIITLKALRNDPQERYRSVAALQADLEHYRRGEVISAKPLNLVDVVKKIIQRNRAVSAVAAVSALIIICGTVVSLFLLNERLQESRRALAAAKASEQLAKEQERLAHDKEEEAKIAKTEAERAMKETELALAKAEKALADVHEAQQALREATDRSDKAQAETQAERKRRESVENIAKARGALLAEREKQLENLQMGGGRAEEMMRERDLAQPPREVIDAVMQANQVLNLELSPYDLQRYDRNPEEVLRRLAKAMDSVSQALMNAPNFVPGWMLKGRLHLAMLEFSRAEESFLKAEEAARQSPGLVAGDSPAEALQMARDMVRTSPGEKYEKALGVLKASGNPRNENVAGIMTFLASKPNLRKSFGGSAGPLARPMTVSEAALTLAEKNGPETKVFIKSGLGTRTEVVIWGADELKDLSPLKDMDVGSLAIVGAKTLDWTTIFSLSAETLDLTKCELETLPVRGFPRVKTFRLAQTDLTNIDFIRGALSLENLDISETAVSDFAPLLAVRSRLRSMDISGLNPGNLRVLMNSPLESLVLSPMLISDKTALNALRSHGTLKVLRAPGDPDGQSAADFWRKLDAGGYDHSE